jgi:uncharacterized repeat protein (TIGR01451 family)
MAHTPSWSRSGSDGRGASASHGGLRRPLRRGPAARLRGLQAAAGRRSPRRGKAARSSPLVALALCLGVVVSAAPGLASVPAPHRGGPGAARLSGSSSSREAHSKPLRPSTAHVLKAPRVSPRVWRLPKPTVTQACKVVEQKLPPPSPQGRVRVCTESAHDRLPSADKAAHFAKWEPTPAELAQAHRRAQALTPSGARRRSASPTAGRRSKAHASTRRKTRRQLVEDRVVGGTGHAVTGTDAAFMSSPTPGDLAQPDWLWDDVASHPTSRWGAVSVADTNTFTEYVFGGYSGSAYLGDLNAYGFSGWSTPTVTGLPSARAFSMAAYDPVNNEVVLFGGKNSSGGLGDTYTWVPGATGWTHVTSAGPPARWGAAMAYDPTLGEVVLYGGLSSVNGPLTDTWVFNAATSTWTQLTSATQPGRRWGVSMVFDPNLPASSSTPTGQMVMFGGQYTASSFSTCTTGCGLTSESDTWVFDGTSWTQLSLATAPSSRFEYSMNYDSSSGQVVLFGGTDGTHYNNETWRFDGTAWTRAVGIASPPALAYMQMATVGEFGFIFGGTTDGATPNGQWWEFYRETPTVTVSPLSTDHASYTVGQSVGFTVSFGNTGPTPLSMANAVATLPSGLALSASAVINNSTGLPCTAITAPSCSVSPTSPTITVSGTQIPKASSLSFTVYGTVASLTSGATIANCAAGTSLPSLASPSGYASQVLSDSPSVYYRLDEPTPTGTARNLVTGGSALNGTYTSSGVASYSPGATGDGDSAVRPPVNWSISCESAASVVTTCRGADAW